MELRDIEIFLTLAEELHFSRTAERLHVTQARVSQSIKKQERRIGAPLFERTSRHVRLTPIGEQLRLEWGSGYNQIMRGIAAATAAARGSSEPVTVGTIGPYFWMLKDAIESFQARHPAAGLRHREIQPPAPLDLLFSGEVDVALLWLPVNEPDLTVGPVLYNSPVLLMVGVAHPFARRESVELEDFADCAFVASRSLPAYMEDALNPFHTPSGRPVPRGPQVSTWQEALTAVASGQAVACVTPEIADFYAWPDLVFLPVVDAPPSRWALVWRTSKETPIIRAFAQAASDVAPRSGVPARPDSGPPAS